MTSHGQSCSAFISKLIRAGNALFWRLAPQPRASHGFPSSMAYCMSLIQPSELPRTPSGNHSSDNRSRRDKGGSIRWEAMWAPTWRCTRMEFMAKANADIHAIPIPRMAMATQRLGVEASLIDSKGGAT